MTCHQSPQSLFRIVPCEIGWQTPRMGNDVFMAKTEGEALVKIFNVCNARGVEWKKEGDNYFILKETTSQWDLVTLTKVNIY